MTPALLVPWTSPLWWLLACDPYASWPDPTTVYPWVYTPQTDLPDYATVRVETETWTPLVDPEQTALYIEKSFAHWPGAPYESLVHFGEQRRRLAPPVPGDLTLDLAGDLLPVDDLPIDWSPLTPHLDGDLRFANLETPVAPGLQPLGPIYGFNADPLFLEALPFDVLQLNNNHTLDVGDRGVAHTVREVRTAGFVGVGVDDHALITIDGTSVAFLTYTWGLNEDVTTRHELFVVPFGHRDPIDLSRIEQDIDAARQRGAELVVLGVHWGYEYEYYPDPLQLQRGRALVEAGADLVVGHGPHVAQPFELCTVNDPSEPPGIGACSVRTDDGEPRVAAILHSLGNLTGAGLTVPTQVGLVARVSLDAGRGVTGLSWAPVAMVDTPGGPQVQPVDALIDDEAFAQESARLDAHMGGRIRRPLGDD